MEVKDVNITGIDFVDLMRSTLSKGACFRMKAYGFSMAPFIKDGDILTIFPLSKAKITIGSVVAYVNPARAKLVIHRIIFSNQGCYCLKGDNCSMGDGFISREQLLGVVKRIERNDKDINFGLGMERFFIAVLSCMNFFYLLPVLRKLKRLLEK